uniref:RGS domain-containing protein n=1 Tax=Heterorhabditis bacteriophora TaxID=37862 RepID=A0A1I7WFT0_HETBA
MFKENVTVDSLKEWQTNQKMEKYTAATFIDKARHLSKSPPDIVQSAEKTRFATVMYRDVYGSRIFRTSDYAQIISDMESFVRELAKFDRKKFWAEFDKTFITGNDLDVKVVKTTGLVDFSSFFSTSIIKIKIKDDADEIFQSPVHSDVDEVDSDFDRPEEEDEPISDTENERIRISKKKGYKRLKEAEETEKANVESLRKYTFVVFMVCRSN